MNIVVYTNSEISNFVYINAAKTQLLQFILWVVFVPHDHLAKLRNTCDTYISCSNV